MRSLILIYNYVVYEESFSKHDRKILKIHINLAIMVHFNINSNTDNSTLYTLNVSYLDNIITVKYT